MHENRENLCDTLAVVLVLNTVQGGERGGVFIVLAVALQVRTGGNCSTKRSFTFLCTAVASFLTVLLYTLTHPL